MRESPPKVITIPAKPEAAAQQTIKRQLRVATYCRVSTDDEGITGTSVRKRPEFLKMIRMCKQKKLDIVLTKSISRFARNTVDCLNYIRALRELASQ